LAAQIDLLHGARTANHVLNILYRYVVHLEVLRTKGLPLEHVFG